MHRSDSIPDLLKLPDEAAKEVKIPRVRTSFLQNVTASLRLQEIISNKKSVAEKIADPSSSFLSRLPHTINSIVSFFSTREQLASRAKAYASYTSSSSLEIGRVNFFLAYLADLNMKDKTPYFCPLSDVKIIKDLGALESEERSTTDKAKLDDIATKKVMLVRNQIIEHGARRADLFFYLLVFYYNKQVIIEKGPTVLQHGKGSKVVGTQACHSSLFPGITPLVEGTYLQDILNMTVELPKIVNDFDGHLEGRFQPTRYTIACLAVLNKVSLKQLTPLEGMNEFFRIMDEFFLHFENKYIIKMKYDQLAAIKKVWEFERQGTFMAAVPNTKTVDLDYLNLMLRVNPADAKSTKKDPLLFEKHYLKIQDEMHTAKSEIQAKESPAKK